MFNCFQGYHNTVPNKRFAQTVFDWFRGLSTWLENTVCHKFVLFSCISSNTIILFGHIYILVMKLHAIYLLVWTWVNLSWIILNSTLLFHWNINETSRISPLTLGKNSTPCCEMIVSHSQAYVYLLCTENSLGTYTSWVIKWSIVTDLVHVHVLCMPYWADMFIIYMYCTLQLVDNNNNYSSFL